MALSSLLCRVPVTPLPAIELLERLQTRKVQPSQTVTLRNGLKVVTARGAGAHSFVGLYSRAGTRYEKADGPRGLSYIANRSIQENLSGRSWLVGGDVDREHSWVTLESAKGTTKDAIRGLAEVVNAPKVTKDSITGLLPQLHDEAAFFRGNKLREFEDMTVSRAFETTSLGLPVYPEHQADMSRLVDLPLVQSQLALHDVANSVLVVVGDVDHNTAIAAADDSFGKITAAGGERSFERARFISGTAFQYTKEHETMTGVAYEAAPGTNAESVAFVLAPHVFGRFVDRSRGEYGADSWDGRRSIIYDFVREYRWNYKAFEDTGLLYFGSVTKCEHGSPSFHQEQAFEFGLSSVTRWMFNLSDEEYLRAQARCLTYLATQSAENAAAHGLEIGRSVLWTGKHTSVADIARAIAFLPKQDFCAIINKHLHMGAVQTMQVGAEMYNHSFNHQDAEFWLWRMRD